MIALAESGFHHLIAKHGNEMDLVIAGEAPLIQLCLAMLQPL